MSEKVKLEYCRVYACEVDADVILECAKNLIEECKHPDGVYVGQILEDLDNGGELGGEETATEIESHAHIPDDWFEDGLATPFGSKSTYQLDELKELLK
jgi:hypothetical protein